MESLNWKVTSKVLGASLIINRISKTTEIPFLNIENKICSEPIEKVKSLNDLFIETGENLNKKFQGQNPYLQVCNKIPNTVPKFRFGFITENSVTKAIMYLKSKRSACLDQIPNISLKIAAPIVSRSLAKGFNISTKTSVFPADWKLACVAPIFKMVPT